MNDFKIIKYHLHIYIWDPIFSIKTFVPLFLDETQNFDSVIFRVKKLLFFLQNLILKAICIETVQGHVSAS